MMAREAGAALPLAWLAVLGFLLVFLVTAGLDRVDSRQLGGVGVWVKPMKFQLSVALHLATLAWVAGRLGEEWRLGWVVQAVLLLAVLMAVLEVAYITVQGAMQQGSHFNLTTRFHATMYSLMATGAVVLTSAAAVLGVVALLDGQARLGPGLRQAVALGLVGGTVLTLIIAFDMGGRMAHHIGTPANPEARWPLVGWSREVGDLRAPHFFATHMMQAVPALGWAADRALPPAWAVGAAWAAALLWAAMTWFLYRGALAGRPFP